MKSDEKFTTLEALAILAWADGVVTTVERSSLIELLAAATDHSQRAVESILNEARGRGIETVDGLAHLSNSALAQLLSTGYAMTHLERPATPAELKVLEQISGTQLSDQWADVHAWLEAKHQADALHDKLFGQQVAVEG